MSVTDRRMGQPGRTAAVSTELGASRVIRRPKNRRAQIAIEAAAAFSSKGYHGVSMHDIAGRLGISSTALYRHYRSKYALFREELFRLAQLTVDAVTLAADAADLAPRERYERIISAAVDETIANRPTVALARWERRFLTGEDRRELDDLFAVAVRRLGNELAQERPELRRDDIAVRSVTAFSVIGSIGDHRSSLPAKRLARLLQSACCALLEIDLPAPVHPQHTEPVLPVPAPFMHELLLTRAVDLFYENGYKNVTMGEIAASVGLASASAIYHYYGSKSNLLTAAFRRAADLSASVIGPTVAGAASPEQALSQLIQMYVEGSFDARALTYVYYAEFRNVAPADRVALKRIQKLVVSEWTKLLVLVRPELSKAEARILVHAGFALVVDLGQALGDDGVAPQNRVIALHRATLFGRA
ncbi:TetR/AcrR family transcriptional regulator [Nocardia asteroides]|uniref:TetR/AcrR family transcriptional regulator n=1 Tax=Nocardia asteroides TaxID=1824 RepID=UPI001E34CB3D|nr:TetR/AcrR family transcriptional regulator [Nocardia asteroides]UGT55088.1 TetR/AcrR family transcriptional regulator [Nocardia asteroides]